jgi:hypothetical protein
VVGHYSAGNCNGVGMQQTTRKDWYPRQMPEENRTGQFDVDDFHFTIEESEKRFDTSSFMQIWLYTGYYSDLDGLNAEYAWSIIKADGSTFDNLAEQISGSGGLPDQDAIVERSVEFLRFDSR